MKNILFLMFMFVSGVAYPQNLCPSTLKTSGNVRDLVFLSDTVSWDQGFHHLEGICGNYTLLHQSNGVYDTRMRVYEKDPHNLVIVFRPTQSTPQGGDIHVDRKLVPCLFLNGSCRGWVDQRFQEAFLSMLHDGVDEDFWIQHVKGKKVSIVGHSLGGSFVIFMGVYLYHLLKTPPLYMIGLAGPFVGNEIFSDVYQIPLHEKMGNRWFQMETINTQNYKEYDSTTETYNVAKTPFIYIYRDVLCGLQVSKIPDSYGMHDLRNYNLFFTGEKCVQN